eukprot:5973763-Prymnesium_polylepis.1
MASSQGPRSTACAMPSRQTSPRTRARAPAPSAARRMAGSPRPARDCLAARTSRGSLPPGCGGTHWRPATRA